MCAHRPTGVPSSAATMAAVPSPPTTARLSSSPPIEGSNRRQRTRRECLRDRQRVADAAADDRTGHGADRDVQEVVRAQAAPASEDRGGGQAHEHDRRQRERLPAHAMSVAKTEQGVEVERDDGDRHGRRSVPAAEVSACRQSACRLPGRRPRVARRHDASHRADGLGGLGRDEGERIGRVWGPTDQVPASGPRGDGPDVVIHREGTP